MVAINRRRFLTYSASAALVATLPAISRAAAEVWTKTATPILTATKSWEQGAVYQPCVKVTTKFEMLYTGGWANAGIGYAQCPLASDPRVAANWVKNSGPILTGVDFNQVIAVGGIEYLLYSFQDKIWAARLPSWDAAPDMATACPVIFQGAASADYHLVGPSPFIDNDGNLNVAYVAANQGYNGWKQYLAKINGPFFIKDMRGPLTTLQLGTGSYGITGNIQKVGAKFQAWQHNAVAGSTPTDIYHFDSADGFTWAVRNGGAPVITRTLPWETAGEQVADAFVLEALAASWMFYDATNNAAPSACIGLAKYSGPLSDICS